jgi:hypothetical protein
MDDRLSFHGTLMDAPPSLAFLSHQGFPVSSHEVSLVWFAAYSSAVRYDTSQEITSAFLSPIQEIRLKELSMNSLASCLVASRTWLEATILVYSSPLSRPFLLSRLARPKSSRAQLLHTMI